ncbi:MAG: ABC-F family ATP-binding cassette domain-containing protein, partial [candidate division Zixibacteria bacterium]|nr:ABC-F family ATP-binding cassette domain-containing protein [candidate division Zixibacteria bacterium]
IGYYDQEHGGLDLESTVIDEVWKIKPQMLASDLRSFLAKFLFFGEDVFRKIKSFSGGEQSRVVLAKLILSAPNFLILDEPTNHLDIASREVLETSLSEFGGTILVVSHDRYFLNKVVSKIYAAENKTLKEYLGNYSYYEEKKKEEKEALQKSLELAKQEKKAKAKIKKAKPKIKKRSLFQIEKEISEIEQKIEEVDYLVSTEEVYTDWQKLLELNEEKKMLSRRLDELLAEWERSAEA